MSLLDLIPASLGLISLGAGLMVAAGRMGGDR